MGDREIDIVRRFAIALDEEDYEVAKSVLAPDCVYLFREKTYNGADAIVESYQGNGEAAKSFDEVRYGSSVRNGIGEWIVIEFWDELHHRGERLRHVCEQWARVENDEIVLIQHHDLEGQREQLVAFKRKMGFGE